MAETNNLRFMRDNFEKERYSNDNNATLSSEEQCQVEEDVAKCFKRFKNIAESYPEQPVLQKDMHVKFLMKGLESLSESYECLDASRPWLCYWILHSLDLLGVVISDDKALKIANFLGKCQSPTGGFGGGPLQEPHLAPTYAAVNALSILGKYTEEAYDVIAREKLQQYLKRMHTPDGGFKMHLGGEVDIRGAYCAASAARLTNVMTESMFDKTPEWIVSCQTYEGGFGGCPGMEAHGGYSFCGLGALILLGHEKLCDIKSLLRWTVNRQMGFEGGFQGRTNKLVDGCYSFWQGGAFPLIHMVLSMDRDVSLSAEKWLFQQEALQEYVLTCCQHPAGGLLDKPGKPRDYYHSCYCLSGLSVAQHFAAGPIGHSVVVGNQTNNELKPVHPVFNISTEAAVKATQHFNKLPVPNTDSV
ncbi:protein farnesyltransferase subunit beta isoform X2 [Lingula anatina]|uniref:Protein farnesyltransferase subunit beta n=1 Tax=Lingula anatina TaxID=7574 RepID=A0A1S3HPM9_LINAN|nr:protein farnesyltransferase subunit beta isoform X1 [Lingula anatina]XP_013386994.1 protein farnesyltransferase subunit beta isoform X2 [Lingula anatina]|eukprot:XP_013386993.1 protein farnesyltransferase subunit beta isoform X1 [Lingula anatina]